MTRVLLCATTTGYQIRSFGAAAQALGVELVFASDRCDRLDDPWFDSAIPVRFHREDDSVQAVVDALRDAPPEGVLAVGDRPTILAARVARAFGLPGNPPGAASASRSKIASRRAFRQAGLLTPSFVEIEVAADAEALARSTSYPAVVKPLALSGSRGVMRANDARELVAALVRLRRLLQSPDVQLEQDPIHDRALIEAFVPGRECAIEGVLTRGAFHSFAIFDKPDPLDGPFFEETIYVTPSRMPDAMQARVIESVAMACGALGLWHGPVHAECRINDAGVYVLEVAARPIGGLCSRALRFAGASLEQLLLRHAIGEDISDVSRESDASGVMMIPIPRGGVYRGVDGVEDARLVDGIDEVTIVAKTDSVLVPLPEGRSYLGFIFARGAEALGVERALRAAHARLHFRIEKNVTLIDARDV